MRVMLLCGLMVLLCACGAVVRTEAATGSAARQVVDPAAVLAAFDKADSAASATGDLQALRRQETGPSLDVSTAAVHTAAANDRTQPPFKHTAAEFAVPDGTPGCFLAEATLTLSGDEQARQIGRAHV